ncbi:MAG: hypothetical protein NXI22_23590 [bacterium]|nr:hypothetical protein [bacterium]
MSFRIPLMILFAFSPLLLIGCGGGEAPTTAETPDAPPSTDNKPPTEKPDAPPKTKTPETTPTKTEITEGWGNLKGRFAIDGSSAEAPLLTINKDIDVCGKHNLRDESIVINESNGGISGVIVWLYLKRGDDAPQPHPSYEETATSDVILDNLNCRFEPHVCLMRTTQTLLVKNSDPIGHNTKIDTQSNPATNRTIPSGAEMTQQFESTERLPAPVSCSIHPWMQGWLVVQDTPYFAVTDKDGNFEINNLPSGEWTFQFWQEKSGYIDEPVVKGKTQDWKKGRAEFTIQGDATLDLGEIMVDAGQFKS